MKILALLDCCVPCYFSGYNRPVISIPVFASMTNKETSEAIQNELNASYDYFIEGYSKTEMLIIDHFCEELLNAPEETFIVCTETVDPENEEDPDYMYFGIIKPVFRHGLTWLNS